MSPLQDPSSHIFQDLLQLEDLEVLDLPLELLKSQSQMMNQPSPVVFGNLLNIETNLSTLRLALFPSNLSTIQTLMRKIYLPTAFLLLCLNLNLNILTSLESLRSQRNLLKGRNQRVLRGNFAAVTPSLPGTLA